MVAINRWHSSERKMPRINGCNATAIFDNVTRPISAEPATATAPATTTITTTKNLNKKMWEKIRNARLSKIKTVKKEEQKKRE